jgi:hypothetical protein
MPELDGIYIFGDYCSANTWSSFRSSTGEWLTNPFTNPGRVQISSFGVDESGELYLVNYNANNGSVLKLVPAA